MTTRSAVLGLGNILFQDEGIGVHAIESFRRKQSAHPGLTIEDGGTDGMKLLPLIEESTHIIIVDSVISRKPPGTLIYLEKGEIPYFSGQRLSQHQQSFQEVLFVAEMRSLMPDYLYFIGVVPREVDWGLDMSPEVAATIPTIVERIEERLVQWGV